MSSPVAFHGRYLASGHLAYVHDQTLFAAPFDLERLELTGPPVPVIEDLRSNVSTGAAQFAASANGTFLYVAGRDGSGLGVPISWLDHDGKTTPLRITPANWFGICFSPDGQRLALDVSSGRSGIGIYEIERDALTFLPNTVPTDTTPKWTPDGRRVTYASTRGDKSTSNLYWQPADGTGEPQRLTTSKNSQTPGSWHPGGKFLAFQELVGPADVDLMILPMEGDEKTGWKPGKPSVFLSTRFTETDPAFSPDGRWIAYVSDESGQRDVYVRPFQGSGKWRVSIDGGTFPTWSRAKPRTLLRYRRREDHGRLHERGRGVVSRRAAAALVRNAVRRPSQPDVRPASGRRTVRGRTRGAATTGRQTGSRHVHLQLLRRAAAHCASDKEIITRRTTQNTLNPQKTLPACSAVSALIVVWRLHADLSELHRRP